MEGTTLDKKTTTEREHVGHCSLEGMHGTVEVPLPHAAFWKQWRAYVGPALLISIGYMDPGNWGTDLSGGASFKYDLLWVVALASLMAIFLQVISARLGVVTGKDLAQCCRDWYPKWTRWPNWLLCELAIGACDLAEVLGSAVAINLLTHGHIPLIWAVIITAGDVLLLLALQRFGMRKIEAVVLVLISTIALCYFIEIFVLPQTKPSFMEMGKALIRPGFRQAGMLYVAIGIIGATVMPHNLYLHSALVQSRKLQKDEGAIRTAIRFNTIDSTVALTVAFFVNAAILVLAAMVFYQKPGAVGLDGKFVAFTNDTQWIQVAYLTLAPLLGVAAASPLFAIALLASGQASTITGTLAGQVVMEGFMHWRLQPWVRRLVTRMLAIIPAILIIGFRPNSSVNDLLNLSQVVLALQLPLAMFPLLHFTSSRKRMGHWKSGWFLLVAGWGSAIVITLLDIDGLPPSLSQAWQVITGQVITGGDANFNVVAFLVLLLRGAIVVPLGGLLGAVFLRIAVAVATRTKISYGRAYVVAAVTGAVGYVILSFFAMLETRSQDSHVLDAFIAGSACFIAFYVIAGMFGSMIKKSNGEDGIGFSRGLLALTLWSFSLLITTLVAGTAWWAIKRG